MEMGRVLTGESWACILVPVLLLVSGPRQVPSSLWVSISSFIKLRGQSIWLLEFLLVLRCYNTEHPSICLQRDRFMWQINVLSSVTHNSTVFNEMMAFQRKAMD